MSLVVSKEGKHISKINYLPQPQLRESFPFFAPSQTRCYTWPLWWQWSLSSGFLPSRNSYSVLFSTGSYRVSTYNWSSGSQYVVQDYFLMLTRWLFAVRRDISPLHVYLIRSFVSRLNPTFLIKPGFHQNSFPCPQKSGLKQPTLCKLKFELTHLRCLTFCLSLANLTWLERKDTIYCMFAIRLKATKESSCGINRWKIISSLPGNINSTIVNDFYFSMEPRGATMFEPIST